MSEQEHKFTESFDEFACFNDTITTEVDGLTITARIEVDDDLDPPWDREDGRGVVTSWTNRGKIAGERVLHEDGGSYRYFDWKRTIAKAKAEGWDCEPFGQGTAGERAERATQREFDVLRAWCNDEWHYCSIILSVAKNGIEIDDHAASLWGIELNYPGSDNSYLTEAANELLGEAIKEAKKSLAVVVEKLTS